MIVRRGATAGSLSNTDRMGSCTIQMRLSRQMRVTSHLSLRRQIATGSSSQEVQVTDPLLAYQALVAKGKLQQDAEQIRVLVELRKLTRTLQDYTPPAHLLGVLQDADGQAAASRGQGHGEQQVPASDENVSALVKYLTEEQQLESLGTPRGLLLTGKPGTGKSFLVDLWFECLPVRGKFRRHYHHLLLSIYRLIWIEAERRRVTIGTSQFFTRDTTFPERGVGAVWERVDSDGSSSSGSRGGSKSIVDWARSLKGMPFLRPDRTSPNAPVSALDGVALDDDANKGMDVVKLAQMERQEDQSAGLGTTLPMHVASQLFLTHGHVMVFDELQLLDIASATLLRRILTSYWRLGGVVVATSNRVPEDLYENNVQRRSLVAFLAALKERCPVVEVGGRDWRVERWKEDWDKFASVGEKGPDNESTFFIKGKPDDNRQFVQLVEKVIGGRSAESAIIKVYNRSVAISESYAATEEHPSVARFTFTQLCDTPLGPADYLTLASKYTIFILDDIPALDLVHRNQARRFITLIDALYEAKCRIILRSQVPLTKIFFAREGAEVAELNEQRKAISQRSQDDSFQDLLQTSGLIQSETLSEAMQDTEEGFRPNISAYGPIIDGSKNEPGRESKRQEEERKSGQKSLSTLSIFSGQEEQFAYQRAVSRLWEMSHSTWGQTSWKPLLQGDMDAWASIGKDDIKAKASPATANFSSSQIGLSREVSGDFADEASYSSVKEPESARKMSKSKGPPVLSPVHIWGVREDWGPKAGRWGRGASGLQDDGNTIEPRQRSPRRKQPHEESNKES